MLTLEKTELILLISAVIALICRRLKLPYTIGLVLAGAIVPSFGLLEHVSFTRDLVFKGLLTPLIFEAAFCTKWPELKRNFAPILTITIIGVLLTTAIICFSMVQFGNWPLLAAATFGALIAATDPVSIIALFKDLKIEGRIKLLVESESLFNDGVAAVLFSLCLTVAAGSAVTAGSISVTLLQEVVGGMVCGTLVAVAAFLLVSRSHSHLVDLTFTVVAAYGSFLLAEHFHASGILAVLMAGLVLGNIGETTVISKLGGFSKDSSESIFSFWEFAAFVANSIVFMLIGLESRHLYQTILSHWQVVALAIGFLMISRAASVYIPALFFARSRHRISFPEQHVLFWGGLKGALGLALAVALPSNFPIRDQVIAVTFGVVAFSIVVQGLTMTPLLNLLRNSKSDPLVA